METSEQEIFAKIHSLLALERNYLAEERTALAEFRTGLMLVLIGPPASAVVGYILSLFPIEILPIFEMLNIMFFAIITIFGIRMSFRSQSELRKTKRRITLLRARIAAIVKSSKVANDLLGEFMDTGDRQRRGTRRELISLMSPRRLFSVSASSIKLPSRDAPKASCFGTLAR